jgi:hypothetical protein
MDANTGCISLPFPTNHSIEFGGIWMNKRFVKEGDRTLSHEMGHVLGIVFFLKKTYLNDFKKDYGTRFMVLERLLVASKKFENIFFYFIE